MDENYINTFLPIQELDDTTQLSADDLVLVSKMLKPATYGSNAKMASMKMRYDKLVENISADLDINGSHEDIDNLSAAIDNVSADLTAMSSAVSISAAEAANNLQLSVDSLSSTISRDYSLKYGEVLVPVLRLSTSPTTETSVLNTLRVEDGKPLTAQSTYSKITDILTLSGYVVANGAAITPSCTILPVTNVNNTQFKCAIDDDCFVNVMISAYETDATCPLEVHLVDNINHDCVMATFNNPGGFSGTSFFNNYQTSFSVKYMNSPSVIVKYSDNVSTFDQRTTVVVHKHRFYGVIAQSNLTDYAKRTSVGALPNAVYKFSTNSDGVVNSAIQIRHDYATVDLCGLVQLSGENQDGNYFGVSFDAEKHARVKVNCATNENFGVVKVNGLTSLDGTTLRSPVKIYNYSDGHSFVELSSATNDTLGIIKLKGDQLNYIRNANNDVLSVEHGLSTDSYGQARTIIPVASLQNFGLIRTGTKPENDPEYGTDYREVFVDNVEGSKGLAKVNVKPDLNYDPDEVQSLAFDDKILVNYSDRMLSNCISFGQLSAQLLQLIRDNL